MTPRTIPDILLRKHPILTEVGLSTAILGNAIQYTYGLLDALDQTLAENDEPPLAELLELANLSAMVGNLFRGGVAKFSGGQFRANDPHTYPDLVAVDPQCEDIEIKVALEKNKPKGHLVKPGLHLTLRYVLGTSDGAYTPGKTNRGDVVWIWEIRVGYLEHHHFNFSNTEGDSGKTAVINAGGMRALHIVFCDLERAPYSKNGPTYKRLVQVMTGS